MVAEGDGIVTKQIEGHRVVPDAIVQAGRELGSGQEVIARRDHDHASFGIECSRSRALYNPHEPGYTALILPTDERRFTIVVMQDGEREAVIAIGRC
jgi:hypothetical protein